MTRDTIAELEIQLDDAKRSYLRAQGWDVTHNTPGSVSMWQRDFDQGVVMTDINQAVQMTMTALDPIDSRPDEDSAE
jgi:hypothetical protein